MVDVQTIFEAMERGISSDGKTTVSKVGGVFLFVIASQQWTVDLKHGEGSVKKGAPPEPADCTLTFKHEEDFIKLMTGKTTGPSLAFTGKLKISGSTALAQKLKEIPRKKVEDKPANKTDLSASNSAATPTPAPTPKPISTPAPNPTPVSAPPPTKTPVSTPASQQQQQQQQQPISKPKGISNQPKRDNAISSSSSSPSSPSSPPSSSPFYSSPNGNNREKLNDQLNLSGSKPRDFEKQEVTSGTRSNSPQTDKNVFLIKEERGKLCGELVTLGGHITERFSKSWVFADRLTEKISISESEKDQSKPIESFSLKNCSYFIVDGGLLQFISAKYPLESPGCFALRNSEGELFYMYATEKIIRQWTTYIETNFKPRMESKEEMSILPHIFVKTHFNNPTFCQHCSEFIWGLGFQGCQCTICEYAIHKRCLPNVTIANCGEPLKKLSETQKNQTKILKNVSRVFQDLEIVKKKPQENEDSHSEPSRNATSVSEPILDDKKHQNNNSNKKGGNRRILIKKNAFYKEATV